MSSLLGSETHWHLACLGSRKGSRKPIVLALMRWLLLAISSLFLLWPTTLFANGTDYQLQPIFTRYAKAVRDIFVDTTIEYFEDVELEEADQFDGWGLNFDITIPFRERSQFQVLVPLYTSGTARLTSPPTFQEIEIEGYGGTFDYLGFIFQHQLEGSDFPANEAFYIGIGTRLRPLDTTHGDKFNHQGSVILGGFRYDWYDVRRKIQFLVNFGGRVYSADDLNPAAPDPTKPETFFWMLEGSAAAVFKGRRVYPTLELVYRNITFNYDSLLFVPELIVPISRRFELKFAAVLGLTDDGESRGARFQLTTRF